MLAVCPILKRLAKEASLFETMSLRSKNGILQVHRAMRRADLIDDKPWPSHSALAFAARLPRESGAGLFAVLDQGGAHRQVHLCKTVLR